MAKHRFTVVNHEKLLPDARIISADGLDLSTSNYLSTQEWREALRACKGMGIRSETFALDAPLIGATADQIKKQLTPYSAAMHNCVIELLQPKGQNKHAIFMVKESESYDLQLREKYRRPAHCPYSEYQTG